MSSKYEHYDTARLNAIPIMGVARRLGDDLKREGSVYKSLCPWHDDRHPSLTFYERTGENRCHCFSCGNGGSVIDYVMQHEGWSFKEACQWLSGEYGICATSSGSQASPLTLKPRKKPAEQASETAYTYIPAEMVDELVTAENSLCRCLKRMFCPEGIDEMVEEYRIGCYAMNGHDDCTAFPSIDINGRVCNVKVQHYDSDPSSPRFGHSDPGSCYWLGSIWSRQGRLPVDATFRSACLFGEHLLRRYPDALVILVESPKNALFGTAAYHDLLWVATGNKGMLKREVLQPLRGRDVIVIPDADAVDEWSAAIATMADLANFTVSDFCRRVAPKDEPKFDIADYLARKYPPVSFSPVGSTDTGTSVLF